MNRALLDRESLNRVSSTIPTPEQLGILDFKDKYF